MLPNVFIWFLELENIGLDPQIMILHEVMSEILEISDFAAAILKNGDTYWSIVHQPKTAKVWWNQQLYDWSPYVSNIYWCQNFV